MAQQYPSYNEGPYDAQPEEQAEPRPREPRESYGQQQPESYRAIPYGAERPSPLPTVPVTIVFKDGRPSEQIHNFLLTPHTLTVFDQHRREIPVNEINLEVTAAMNLKEGIVFSVPGQSR
jgi:hypothetical protein